MKICKWAGDVSDEYCKSCDGCTMTVAGETKSCSECAGYEPADEEAEVENAMPEPVEEVPFEEDNNADKHVSAKNKAVKKQESITNTPAEKKPLKTKNTTSDKVVKISEELNADEKVEKTDTGIKVTALRYTSSATVKKGDNYFKFTAEEEWSTNMYDGDIQDVRDMLWAKLNDEVDKQIEDLNKM